MKDDLVASRKVQKAAEKIVEYMWDDEFKNYNGEPDHIVHSVRVLREWLGDRLSEGEAEMMRKLAKTWRSEAA